MSAPAALPQLDLRRMDGSVADVAAFHVDLREASHDVGFFYVSGHGVPDELSARVFEVARQFFALPAAEKQAVQNIHSPHFRGYTRVGGELTRGRTDWREQIDIGPEQPAVPMTADSPAWARLQGPNLWPASLPELKTVCLAWTDALSRVGRRIAGALAASLGQHHDLFDGVLLRDPSHLLKIIHYPGQGAAEDGQGVGSHKDSGLLTLLLQEPGVAGLQVELAGRWVDVPALPGTFVVNIGELLEVASDGYLSATAHRVVSPPADRDRYSVAFFCNPALDAPVPAMALPPDLAAQAGGPSADPANPLFATYGENALKSRLRAHPDVAQKYHADLLARGG